MRALTLPITYVRSIIRTFALTALLAFGLAAPAAMIKISGLSDVSFTKTVGDAQLTPETRDACVHMDQPGTYSITITAEPLTSSDGRSYPYQVVVSETASDFETTLDVTDETEIANGDGLIPSSSSNCGDTETLDLVISEEGDLTEAFSATTTITLLVTPE